MALRVAVCDDDPAVCGQLLSLLKAQSANCAADVYPSGEALLHSARTYDLYLLDIQMPGMGGLRAAQVLRERQRAAGEPESAIVFVTALRDYMQDAFDVGALHYLVKPIDEGKFAAVFRRAAEEWKRRRSAAGKYFTIKRGDSHHKIFLRDIAYIESRDKKNIVYTADGAQEYYGKLGELASALGDSFFRCHRSYIVNMAQISRYSEDRITLENGATVYIAQKKYREFVKAYLRFARDGGAV
jgi:DNA-binding LytR/AlgR family response regulator